MIEHIVFSSDSASENANGTKHSYNLHFITYLATLGIYEQTLGETKSGKMDRSPAFRTIFILLQFYTDSLGRNLSRLSERFPLLEPNFQPLSWSPNRCVGKNKWVFDPFLSFFPACPVSFLYEDLYRDLKRARNKWRKTRFPTRAASRVSATTFFTRNKIANSWPKKRETVKAKIHRFFV